MTYARLRDVTRHIERTHSMFGGAPVAECFLQMNKFRQAMAKNQAMVGATWKAVAITDDGDLHTLVTINRLPDGSWECIEKLDREAYTA